MLSQIAVAGRIILMLSSSQNYNVDDSYKYKQKYVIAINVIDSKTQHGYILLQSPP